MDNLLWNDLCRNIGTEEQVYVRRIRSLLFQFLQNKIPPLTAYIYIDSGSRAEGLDLPGSDTDFMYVSSDISVLPKSYPMYHQADLIMDTENLKPGFTYLRVTDNSRCLLVHQSSLVSVGNNYFLSSLLFRDGILMSFQKHDPNFVQHGPCATDTSGLGGVDRDIAFCLSCKQWPAQASEWIQRHRPNNWPASELVRDIVREGCLLVPIGNPYSGWSHLEWRISFSLAEKKLVHSMNHTQILCYGFLKLFLKYFIELDEDLKDTLCSYFLKTCLFFSIEEESIIWSKSNIINCLHNCFFRLQRYVLDAYCPNYFIKDSNMFEGKVHGLKQVKLLYMVSSWCQNGLTTFISRYCSLRLCNNMHLMSGILQQEIEYLTDTEVYNTYHLFSSNSIHRSVFRTANMLDSFLVLETIALDLDKLLIIFMLHYYRVMLSQLLYKYLGENMGSNENRHKLVKIMKHILHTCGGSGMCTGLLHYATLCYNIGQYNTVICIVHYLMDRLKPYAHYYGNSDIQCDINEYKSHICGRGLTYRQKMAYATSQTYQVITDSRMYACDIDTVVTRFSHLGSIFIPPAVYSNVLLFLSYKKLEYTELKCQALNELNISSHSDRFVTELERPLALALFDKCMQLNNE